MSLAAACIGTLIRTFVLCLLAWPICLRVERWLRQLSDRWRSLAFMLMLAPALFPELLVGYTYRSAALASTRQAEWICFGLLLIRIVPVGVVTLLASPKSLVDRAAVYCRWLKLREQSRSWIEVWHIAMCLWNGPIRRTLPALGLMTLVAYQEFELAALLQTASWTDWFIAAERFGLERHEMLRQSLWPILIQLPLLVGIIAWTVRPHDSRIQPHDDFGSRGTGCVEMIYLCGALLFGCLVPIGFMASNLVVGLTMIARQPTQLTGIIQEISIAAAVSICAGGTTWIVSQSILNSKSAALLPRIGRQFLLLPGLAGSLLLSLGTGILFQQPWLRFAYDTPLPWVLVLMVWLLPRAVLVRLWVETVTQTEGVRLAEMLNENRSTSGNPATALARIHDSTTSSSPAHHPSSLLFRLRDQPRLLAVGLLCYWAYLDLSTAYLLAPSGLPSGLVRLYNFMHFGRSSALSAEAFLFFGIPMLTIAIVTFACGIIQKCASGIR